LNPKQLIQKYQLDQSQLAFTFCALSDDGTQFIPEWDTTVYSTVLTGNRQWKLIDWLIQKMIFLEMPPENSKQKSITCPQCTHQFQVAIGGVNDEQGSVQETSTNKRKMYPSFDQRTIKVCLRRISLFD
jgi:hypothetical protein